MAPRIVGLIVCLFAAGCAARRPSAPPRDVFAESTVLLRAGCYRCLEEALSLVESRADAPARQRAFELAVLLAIRSKELGLPFEPWRTRAATIAAGVPTAVATTDFLSVVDTLRQDPAGLDRDQDFAQRLFGMSDTVRPWLAAIESSGATNGGQDLCRTCRRVRAGA